MLQSLETTRIALQEDHRAWMQVKIGEPADVADGGAVKSVVTISNTGNTPARHILVYFVLRVIENEEFFDPNTQAAPSESFTTGAMFPNEPIKVDARLLDKGRVARNISHPEYIELQAGRAYIAIYVKVQYRDVFGVDHWTQRCAFQNNINPYSLYTSINCTEYNNIDSNYKP